MEAVGSASAAAIAARSPAAPPPTMMMSCRETSITVPSPSVLRAFSVLSAAGDQEPVRRLVRGMTSTGSPDPSKADSGINHRRADAGLGTLDRPRRGSSGSRTDDRRRRATVVPWRQPWAGRPKSLVARSRATCGASAWCRHDSGGLRPSDRPTPVAKAPSCGRDRIGHERGPTWVSTGEVKRWTSC